MHPGRSQEETFDLLFLHLQKDTTFDQTDQHQRDESARRDTRIISETSKMPLAQVPRLLPKQQACAGAHPGPTPAIQIAS
ncbi:MAG: hypothetical protein N838_35340 [Thiohalocapsa sp. PB-PSB1]|nr:MAG: hypothetical protein N838_35340 [Thiohalocapsa sp. PB-PSB1]